MTKKVAPDSFELRLEKLEKLVELLENGDISLDESLKAFETGVSLTKSCLDTLKKAELKVKQLDTLEMNSTLSDVNLDK